MKVRRRGFTIVELLIVIVVIGIVTSVAYVSYGAVTKNARDRSVLSDLDSLDGIEASFAVRNNNGGIAWYSGPSGTNGTRDGTLQFTPTKGNIIDAVVNGSDYCIRVYNKSSKTYTSLQTAASKGSTTTACASLPASSGAVTDSP